MKKLISAFEYLRPRMQGDTLNGIPPNAEAEAGSIIANLMVSVIQEQTK